MPDRTVVQLRDIVTDADRAAVLDVRRGPGQDRFVATVQESFDDAIRDAHANPRVWAVTDGDEVVGFAMISDGIPADRLAADPELLGPYFLWRLLIDERRQRRGYGTATLDAVVDYVRSRPGGETLHTSCTLDPGTPLPFYERYGFVSEDRFVDGELVLRLDLASG
jgi:diamine N-acetyltransferase